MIYIKLFENHSEYNDFSGSTEYIEPNVSHCIEENDVHYNVVPNFKWIATYDDGHTESAECDSKTEIALGDVPIDNLVSLKIGNCITSIGVQAFSQCSTLTTLDIPSTLKRIGKSAFLMCSNLTGLTIPNGVEYIGDTAFFQCESITSVSIPKSVREIHNGPFSNCRSLTSIVVDSGNPVYESRNNGIIKKSTNELIQGCSTTVIPDGVTSIKWAFNGCATLTGITIPNSVTNIGDHAFTGCEGLTGITIPDGVTNIGDYSFFSCNRLTNLVLPNSVTNIGEGAFNFCNGFTSFNIPSSVTSIGKDAFLYARNLGSVTVNATTPPTLGEDAFSHNAEGRKIYVPAESVDAYKAAPNWSVYANDIEPIS